MNLNAPAHVSSGESDDSSDDEDNTTYTLLRVNTTGSNVFDSIGENLTETAAYDVMKQLIKTQSQNHIRDRRKVDPLYEDTHFQDWHERAYFEMWCTDGLKHRFATFGDEFGKTRDLQPNHRFNAMVTAGRFETLDYTSTANNANQQIKDYHGSNFCVGDIFCLIPQDHPPPNFNVIGENPLEFILMMNTQIPSTDMIDRHGSIVAKNMIHSEMIRRIPQGHVTLQQIRNAPWEHRSYGVMCSWGASDSFKELLRSWGFVLRSPRGSKNN